jgi:flagellin
MSSLSINSGINATFARQKSKGAENDTSQKLEEMASGLSLDSESQATSDVSVSAEVDSQLRGGSQEIQNLQENLSILQEARDGTRQVQENLEGLRDLAVEAVNSNASGDEAQERQDEASRLLGAIDDTVSETEFNGETLLAGGSNSLEVQTGEGRTENVSLGDLSTDSLGLDEIELSTAAEADESLGTLNGAINQVATEAADLNDAAEEIATSIDSTLIQQENETAARSQIRDSDLARESTERAQSSILNQAGTSAFAQANNLEGSSALQLLG